MAFQTSSEKSRPSVAMQSIVQAIVNGQDSDGTWGLGIEPFYRISQTTFALRVLLWYGKLRSVDTLTPAAWLQKELSQVQLSSYTRTLAWPIYLFSDQKSTENWELVLNKLTDRLVTLQNQDGSWGHGKLSEEIQGSGAPHPFPTALSVLALSKSPQVNTPKVVQCIREAVHWLLGWINTATSETIASWALSLLALHEANTHEIDATYFHIQTEKLAYLVNISDHLILEEIPNAARHLDAPYILLSPAWVLIALSRLGGLQTLSAQLRLVRMLLTLIQEDGRVGRVPSDPTPHVYSAFNVYFALQEFYRAHSSERLLSNLIREENAVEQIIHGARKIRATVFIGSSVEGLKVARAIQQNFEHDNFDCVIWEQGVFRPTQTTIESLEDAIFTFDFAVLVLTPDDYELSRGSVKPAIRDNVLFEFGLFMGALGRSRVFGIHPRGNFQLPSDLLGLSFVDYDVSRFGFNAQSAVASACDRIRTEMVKLGPR